MKEPRVVILDRIDCVKDAWEISRPGFDFSTLDVSKIKAMDLSINSIPHYILKIRSSILFRDIMLGLRPIHPWARSLRSAPLDRDHLHISSEFSDDAEYHGQIAIQKVIAEIKSGTPQDLAREGIPLSLSTVFTVAIDMRTLIGFIKTIRQRGSERMQVYANLLSDAVGHHIIKSSTVGGFYDSYSISPNEVCTKSGRIGDMRFGRYDLKNAMASQFLRQHNSLIKTGYWNSMHVYGEESATQEDTIPVVCYIQEAALRSLIKLRSHWFADWSNDMWGNVVGDYIEGMSLTEFWKFLPNGAGKKDPYHRDMLSRITGEEHNLPCPIMCEWPDLIFQRLALFGPNPVIIMYKGLAEAGFITDNPDNKYRIQYLEMKDARR